ncbi:MAG: hypothetical protein Q8L64_03945 [bacterium]|nr:hypothetical protein [bacterium]
MNINRPQQVKYTEARKNQGGFAMLFAVLTSSVLLSIGLSIFNLTIKEIVLSSSGRESQFAFYAADTGIECAFYWDFKGVNVFATSSESGSRNPLPASPDCVSVDSESPQTINITPSVTDFESATTRFSLSIPNVDAQGSSAPYCVFVTVTKELDDSIILTTIDSRGYNVGEAIGNECVSDDPNRVERAIRVKY